MPVSYAMKIVAFRFLFNKLRYHLFMSKMNCMTSLGMMVLSSLNTYLRMLLLR